MPTASYPVDYTGQAASNLVQGETHTLTEVNAAPYRILIPTFAPFYLHNFELVHVNQLGVETPLHEGTDYYFALPYMAASRSTGQPVFGGIAMISTLVQGTIKLKAYQTVGGPWCADAGYVYEQLLLDIYNRRTTWWDQISNVQSLFPATEHGHPLEDVDATEALLEKLDAIVLAIAQSPVPLLAQIQAHINSVGNVHGLTKAQLGVGNVENLPMATDQEVLALADVSKYITLRQLKLLLSQLNLV